MQETRSRYSSTDCGICWSIIENGKINNLSSFLSHNILLFSQRGLKCLVFPQHRLNKYTIVCRIQPHQWMECRIARSCNSGDSTSWNGISPIRWWNSDWITSRRSRRNIRFLLIPMCNRQSQAAFENYDKIRFLQFEIRLCFNAHKYFKVNSFLGKTNGLLTISSAVYNFSENALSAPTANYFVECNWIHAFRSSKVSDAWGC